MQERKFVACLATPMVTGYFTGLRQKKNSEKTTDLVKNCCNFIKFRQKKNIKNAENIEKDGLKSAIEMERKKEAAKITRKRKFQENPTVHKSASARTGLEFFF